MATKTPRKSSQPSPQNERTAAFVKSVRKELKLTQSQLAEALQVSSAAVNHWEAGRNSPSDNHVGTMSTMSGLVFTPLSGSAPSTDTEPGTADKPAAKATGARKARKPRTARATKASAPRTPATKTRTPRARSMTQPAKAPATSATAAAEQVLAKALREAQQALPPAILENLSIPGESLKDLAAFLLALDELLVRFRAHPSELR